MNKLILICIGVLSITVLSIAVLYCSGPKTELDEFKSELWAVDDGLPRSLFGYKLDAKFSKGKKGFEAGRWGGRSKSGDSYERITDTTELNIYVYEDKIDHITFYIKGDPVKTGELFGMILGRYNDYMKEDANYGVKVFDDDTIEMRLRYVIVERTFNDEVIENSGNIAILLRPSHPDNSEYNL